ncbi:hypothetical protein THA_656 [Thermosipho africanus TCF52B]|uniref:3'-phosphate/5'-hydroxy nucleic acid ligase n=1 Tax=Thermosipho africanus (strain TCF52B) TaxID=484019 RepID=B7IGB9_THEAB|nr:hypothetical protein [Thermosipho africanus]ACJ75133.1 hypothetical protein THA_656 [Thermosipho africanus TCF52B]
MNKELHKIQKKEPILIINDNDYREFCNEKARKVINFYKNHSEYNKIIIFPGFHPEEFGLPASSLLLSDKIYPFSTGFDVGCGYLILIVYDIDPIKMNKITKKLENSNEISKIFNKNIENSSWIIKKMNKITKNIIRLQLTKPGKYQLEILAYTVKIFKF